MIKIEIALLLPDLHYPYHNKECVSAITKLAKDLAPWDYLIYMGDQMDFKCISHWYEMNLRALEGTRLKVDYSGFQKDILDVFDKIVGKKCKKVFFKGNHEEWVEQAINKNPRLEGYWEPENNLKLQDYTIIPFNRVYKLGKLNVIHGFYTGKYHAAKTVDEFGKSVVYGHTHDDQSYTKMTAIDVEDFHTAQSIGCLSNMNPDFMKNRPNKWVHSFGIVYLLPDGSYNIYVPIIISGRFIWNGKLYDGNK